MNKPNNLVYVSTKADKSNYIYFFILDTITYNEKLDNLLSYERNYSVINREPAAMTYKYYSTLRKSFMKDKTDLVKHLSSANLNHQYMKGLIKLCYFR